MDKLLLRGAVILLLCFLGYQISVEHKRLKESEQEMESAPVDAETPRKSAPNPMWLFTLYLFMAAGIGFVALKWVIPAFGDKVSEAFLGSGEKIVLDDNARAMALVTQGNYEAAIKAFEGLAEKNPTDRFPIVEMARIYRDKLHDPNAAMKVYSDALSREWPDDDAGFFRYEIAVAYYDLYHETATAKEMLREIIAAYPGTMHAGHATQKLREIEEAEFLATRGH